MANTVEIAHQTAELLAGSAPSESGTQELARRSSTSGPRERSRHYDYLTMRGAIMSKDKSTAEDGAVFKEVLPDRWLAEHRGHAHQI